MQLLVRGLILAPLFYSATSLGFFVSFDLLSLSLSTQSAHELITEEAIVIVEESEDTLKPESYFDDSDLEFFSEVPYEQIKAGVFAMDIPRGRNFPVDLPSFWGFDKDIDWHNDPKIFHFHSLRNFSEDFSEMDSAKKACEGTQNVIVANSAAAIEFWKRGDSIKSFFMLGVALHTLQDSFSSAHVERNGMDDGFQINQVCHYTGGQTQQVMGLCHHEPFDHRDHVWLLSDEEVKAKSLWLPLGELVDSLPAVKSAADIGKFDLNSLDEVNRKNYFSHEGRLAMHASAQYIMLMGNLLDKQTVLPNNDELVQRKDIDPKMEAQLREILFDHLFLSSNSSLKSKHIFPKGVLNCNSLEGIF